MKELPQLSQLTLFGEDDLMLEVETVIQNVPLEQEELVPYELGDRVIVQNEDNEDNDPEAYFYLKDFERKKGIVEKVTLKPKLQYQVRFGDSLAFVYHHEITV